RPGEVEMSTRSGNTATPDQTWSPWSSGYTTSSGDKITSPNARYLQWRAVLKAPSSSSTPSPVLTSVTAAYLPRNLRPPEESSPVHPSGPVFQRPFSPGELEIAGFEENPSDGRGPQQGQGGASG